MGETAMTERADVRQRVIFVSVAIGINTLAYSIIYPFLPIYLHATRGIPMATVGLVFPAMGVATIIGAPLSGMLLDRFGRRPLLVGGPIARSASFFGLAWMAHVDAPFWALTAMLFCAALVGSFFRNAANTYVTDLVPPEKRTDAFSAMRIGLNIGWMTGPAIGAFLARTPFSLLFALTAALCLGTAFIAFWFCPAIPFSSAAKRGYGLRIPMRQLLRDERELLMLLGLCLLLFLSVAQFVSTLSIYATEVVGITRNSLGFLYTLNGAIVIVFQMPFNRLLDQWNLRLRIAAGALIYVVAFAGFALSAVWLHLALSIGLMTVGEILAMTAISSLVSQLAPVDRVGRYMGTLGLAQGLGWAVGPYFGSVLFAVLKMQPLMLWGVLSLGAFVAACGFAVTARFGSSHKAV